LNNENNININTNINREAENQLSNSEMNNNINNSNNNNIVEEKSNIKEENINNKYIPQNIPKSNLYHYNTSSNKNYINDNNNYNQNIKEDINNNKTEIIINRSPSDYYYNTLHEEYLPKKEESPIKNNRIYRTYEIDSSKYDDNKNSLFGHSSIYNDLMRKNGNYYC